MRINTSETERNTLAGESQVQAETLFAHGVADCDLSPHEQPNKDSAYHNRSMGAPVLYSTCLYLYLGAERLVRTAGSL